MSGASRHQKLIEGLREKHPGKLVEDGPVTAEYWEAKPRVLWILKEAHSAEDAEGWSLPEFLRDGYRNYPNWKRTYAKVAQVSWGLLHEPIAFEGLPGYDELPGALRKFAVINVDKTIDGRGTSNWADLVERYKIFREPLLEQISLLEPDIVISGNVLGLFADDLELGERVHSSPSLHVYSKQGRIFLDAHHPACWSKSQAGYYDEIIGAVRASAPNR